VIYKNHTLRIIILSFLYRSPVIHRINDIVLNKHNIIIIYEKTHFSISFVSAPRRRRLHIIVVQLHRYRCMYIVYIIIIIIFGSNGKCGKLAINFNYEQ